MPRRRPAPGPSISLHRLPQPSPDAAASGDGELPGELGPGVVFVTNALRSHGGLRTRGEQRRHVVAAVLD
jgi:hypothetical protein